MDRDLVLSCYWPGAHDDHGAFHGTAEEFVEWLEVLRHYDSTMHFVGNQLVEIDGDTARAESYCVAYHRRGAQDGEQGHDLVLGLRYVDRMERRDGEWRIADRKCAFDWSRIDPVTAEWDFPQEALRGRRDNDDPVYLS